MNPLTAEQVVAAHKANIEVLFGLTEKAYAGIEKLVELNMQVARTALAEAAEHAHATLSVKDAQELLARVHTHLTLDRLNRDGGPGASAARIRSARSSACGVIFCALTSRWPS